MRAGEGVGHASLGGGASRLGSGASDDGGYGGDGDEDSDTSEDEWEDIPRNHCSIYNQPFFDL